MDPATRSEARGLLGAARAALTEWVEEGVEGALARPQAPSAASPSTPAEVARPAAAAQASLLEQPPSGPRRSLDEVRAEVRHTIDCLGRDGGYVLNSVHNIQNDVPAENVIAMLDEARRYATETGRTR